jgi:hypothetical protein
LRCQMHCFVVSWDPTLLTMFLDENLDCISLP